MPITMEEFMRKARRRAIQEATVEERLEGLPTEEFLKRVPPEEVLKRATLEERLLGLTPEDREKLLRLLTNQPPTQSSP